jgi:tricarballylate dehydrogenase
MIVGAGNAAQLAALSASECGARAILLEAAPEQAMGGNSRFTLGGFRFGCRHPDMVSELVPDMCEADRALVMSRGYTPDEYFATLQTLSKGQADPVMCRLLAENSFPTLKWMRTWGVRWNLHIWGIEPEPMWRGSPGNVYATGRGPGLIVTLLERVRSAGIEIRYSHRLEQVLLDASRRVRGVVVARGADRIEIPCRSLVMACGGFEANREMRQAHLGEAWAGMKVRGTKFNTGLGLTALFEIGAQRAGQWDNGHAVPVAADAPDFGTFELGETTRRCLFQYGISVDRHGRRFMDEGADRKTFMYSTTGLAVATLDGGVAFQLFDARLHTANFEKAFYFSGRYHTAETLPELAAQIGNRPDDLVAEVERYNAAVAADDRFDPTTLDGSAAPGIVPPRSNFAAKIHRPPYYAFEVAGGMTFTYGGVRIDDRCRVLDTRGQPIAGLFAAGEMAGGFFANTYPANAGLMRGAVTGRIAGASAAAYAVAEEVTS